MLEDNPKTSYEDSRTVFRGTPTVYQRGFALAETLAHLELERRSQRKEDGTVAYRAR